MDDPVDDLLRDRFRDGYPLRNVSEVRLPELMPQMVRARSRRQTLHVSAGLATASAVLLGALVLLPQMASGPSQLDVAGPADSTIAADSNGAEAVPSPTTTGDLGRMVAEPSDEASTTSAVEPTSSVESTTAASTSETTSLATASTTTAASTTTTGATTSTAPTTTTLATTTTEAATSVVSSSCGTLEVRIDGAGVALVATNPIPGMSVDVKNSGPAQVEVRLEDESLRCEVVVENRSGQIWSDVHEEKE